MSKQSSQLWFHSARVSWRFASLACAVWLVLLILLARSVIGSYLESNFASPVNFQIRHLLHNDPEISSKLRIYAVDDATVIKINRPTLNGRDWAAVFSVLAKSEAKAIVIDGMFSQTDEFVEEFEQALAALQQRNISVTVGAFFNPNEVTFRDPLPYRSEYELAPMISDLQSADRDLNGEMVESNLPPMRPTKDWVAYGPAARLGRYLSHIGHFTYAGDGRVSAFIRMDDRLQTPGSTVVGPTRHQAAVAHMSIYVAEQRKIVKNHLILNDHVVPISPDGSLAVNFPDPAVLHDRVIPIWSLLEKAAKGAASSVVKKGDIVFIMPQYYTGNTDFKQTPFGQAPGGYVIAGMVNSVITGQWLKPLAGTEGMITLFAVVGALIGMNFGAAVFWLVLLGAVGGCFGLSIWMFSYHAIIVPWLMPLTGCFAVAMTIFAEKTRLGEKKAQALRASLAGLIAADDLKSIMRKPESVNFEARERVVTLMFIDVVGFSLLAENILPRIAFEQLKKMLLSLGDCVHEYGGIIDKTLGDGLLCYFGYRFDGDTSVADHAEQALRCAIKIQEDNLARNIEAARSGEAIHPLRIGINTASCYLGDLGSGSRIDFTVVGNGVNFAKRLEGACEMHSVLMGATTSDLVRGIGLPPAGFNKRLIRIKHHSELVEAFEYDPFFARPQMRMEALEGFKRYAKIDRLDQRWPVKDATTVQLNTSFGPGTLVNFAHGSLGVKFKQLLTPGSSLQVELDAQEGRLKNLLVSRGLHPLVGEVLWGYSEGAEFVHGLHLTQINEEQGEFLVQKLCEFAFATEDEKGPQANRTEVAS